MQPCSVVGCDCPALDDASGCCASHLPSDQFFELGDIAFVADTDDATLVPLDGVPGTIVYVAPTQF
ncbi:LOW QUALITY PROTEIN: hypothetical protein SPRG_09239 [Saprolegnia parasitica CBS 223.65]|uniref:Uncharacterized protein n=1 Tax=Saprolegnia parasitica (strain CBS 223.65) TaxID=695850 RepID=A0A067CE60_SAPPC|nr:LOW QUALITY PROTEIN: hypothetical protein SPRG_09239 [Saprolegnia parasitica CBS 223.65]KDO25097.1 LOW QUALITY PROTEIN: hypothetical protein SPRG_09239 [Saprolegnia parasitica CBS 223.65]|eukprot:XP_012204170.1 LOW QUALITY PROTEIN: hypothetical protein SPRG_09239 [Saprolegnia parasitica CBS 223.65]